MPIYRAHRRFIGPNIHQPKLLHPLVILSEAKDLTRWALRSFADAQDDTGEPMEQYVGINALAITRITLFPIRSIH